MRWKKWNMERKEESGISRGKEVSFQKEVQTQLKIAATALIPEKTKRQRAMEKIQKAIQRKTINQTYFFRELLIIELQHISPIFWVVQGILVGCLVIVLEKTSLAQGTLADYLRWTSVLAAWMGVLGCSSLARHFSRGMAELEQSCYFNLPQLWSMKMTLSGGVDILVLVLGSGRIAEKTGLPFAQVCLYVLVPFVLSNVCCLLFFTALRGGRGRYGQLATALALGALAAIPGMTPGRVYQTTCLWGWVAALTVGIGLYLWELKFMFGKMERGEILCWN